MPLLPDDEADSLARKALLGAAEIIRQGHCKDQYATDKFGNPVLTFDPRAAKYCVTGALMKASCRLVQTIRALQQVHSRACDRLVATLPKLGYDQFEDISAWNDCPDRTCDEVAAALIEASQD